MSPSTGVLSFMASMAQEFEVVVEQSEDFAWYSSLIALATLSDAVPEEARLGATQSRPSCLTATSGETGK